jgi:hypothetical protein
LTTNSCTSATIMRIKAGEGVEHESMDISNENDEHDNVFKTAGCGYDESMAVQHTETDEVRCRQVKPI